MKILQLKKECYERDKINLFKTHTFKKVMNKVSLIIISVNLKTKY